MRKIGILYMMLLFVISLSGCQEERSIRPDFDAHLLTMNARKNYVVEVISYRENYITRNQSESYVYVDNTNNTFIYSDNEKATIEVERDDIVFEYKDRILYGYVFEDQWNKYEVESKFMNIKNFEWVLLEYFDDAYVSYEDDKVIYSASLTLNDIKGQLYEVIEEKIDNRFYDIEFPIKAVYDTTLEQFTEFEFDFTGIYRLVNDANDTFTFDSAYWMITISIQEVDEEFEVVVNNALKDDYLDDFTGSSMFTIDHMNSYDVVEGTVDYAGDNDVFIMDFLDDEYYSIYLMEVNNENDVVVAFYTMDGVLVHEAEVSAQEAKSDYWFFEAGTYYVTVSGKASIADKLEYKFLVIKK